MGWSKAEREPCSCGLRMLSCERRKTERHRKTRGRAVPIPVPKALYPLWTGEELEVRRGCSREMYVKRYKNDVRARFAEVEHECQGEVRALFELTDSLPSLGETQRLFAEHPQLLTAARFVTRPAISADTLTIIIAPAPSARYAAVHRHG